MAHKTPTRWERVREILDAAAGDSTSNYGGVGRPWRLSLDQLRTVEVYGVRMVAPPVEEEAAAHAASGCGCGCATTAERPGGQESGARFPRYPGRGAASGLVKGLRGQAPYDGSVFPRLPWGGAAVADDDVQFISDWIDDGLPADHETSLPADMSSGAAGTVRLDQAPVEPTVVRIFGPVLDGADPVRRPGEVRQRMNLDCMTDHQHEELRAAFRELYALNKWPADRRSYNNMALIHQDHCQHGWERFLPWHRVYLYEMEQVLQDVAPGVTLPYWDFTMPQYRPDCPDKGIRIPLSYQAFLTDEAVSWLAADAVPRLPRDVAATVRRMVGQRYTSLSTFFKAMMGKPYNVPAKYTRGEYRNRFIDALLGTNALWYPLRWPGEYKGGQTINQAFASHYPKPEDIREILALTTFRDFGGGPQYDVSFGFLDQNPHNTMHIWTGGANPDYVQPPATPSGYASETATPQELAAAGAAVGTVRNRAVRARDRRFHSRDDMYYAQQPNGDMFSNLTASFDPVFWPVHVNIDRLWWEWQLRNPGANPVDQASVLTPWSYTVGDTLEISRFGYEYVRSTCMIPVGLEAPVGRFVSRPIAVPTPARTDFRTAEVRLHRVPQLDRSCFIRVFLNLPDADAHTPVDHPSYAGYLAIFGHGDCIGGPGHCAVPDRRPYDLRPRSHNTPRNHRVNVTTTARRLLQKGKELQITLVVIGADYCEDNEVLRLEGVSLNFLD